MTLVYDASALLDLVPSGERHPTAKRLALHVVARRGAVAPALIAWEIGSALIGRGFSRQPRAQPAEVLLEDPLGLVRLETPDAAQRRQTIRIATTHSLSVYHAAYVAAAQRVPDRMLITEDGRLLEAARNERGRRRAATAAEACRWYVLPPDA